MFCITKKGFTLVELLVVVVVFSIIIGATIGVFVSVIRVQRYTLAAQQLLDQTSYVMEYMSRSVRMAKKDTDGDCIEPSKANYELTKEKQGLKFENYNHECQEFYLEDSQFYQKLEKPDETIDVPLISSKFNVSPPKFNLSGEEQPPADDLQPRVTILLEIKGKAPGSEPEIRIQTTISQRDLDIKE